MLEDLRALFSHTNEDATWEDYRAAVVAENILGKPTKKARELSLRHLSHLYGLDRSSPIFRALRRLWPLDESAQPVLALCAALARDPLLRLSEPFYLTKPIGIHIPREEVEQVLDSSCPGRFSAASLKSFAQNVAGTWTFAGFLNGKARKIRSLPLIRPENAAFCLFLGYLEGRSGQRLFSSDWMKLLGGSSHELEALANSASHRGLLVFMDAGGVKEVRFPGYLIPEEESTRQEIAHVL